MIVWEARRVRERERSSKVHGLGPLLGVEDRSSWWRLRRLVYLVWVEQEVYVFAGRVTLFPSH